jgi:hypothetical protein
MSLEVLTGARQSTHFPTTFSEDDSLQTKVKSLSVRTMSTVLQTNDYNFYFESDLLETFNLTYYNTQYWLNLHTNSEG